MLVLLWACSEDETRALAQEAGARHGGLRLMARASFMANGAAALAELQRPLDEGLERRLRRERFPESEVVFAVPARRRFERDNRAALAPLFLDAQQEWATKLDLELPAEQAEAAHDLSVWLINGVAGSGKTLIAHQQEIGIVLAIALQPRGMLGKYILGCSKKSAMKYRNLTCVNRTQRQSGEQGGRHDAGSAWLACAMAPPSRMPALTRPPSAPSRITGMGESTPRPSNSGLRALSSVPPMTSSTV
jgi:hypothetical protein